MTTHEPELPMTVAGERFVGGSVVQLVDGDPRTGCALVANLLSATITVWTDRVAAVAGDLEWSWRTRDLSAVHHAADEPWSMLVVPGVADHGVAVREDDVARFRHALDSVAGAPSGGWPRPAAPQTPQPSSPPMSPGAGARREDRRDESVVDDDGDLPTAAPAVPASDAPPVEPVAPLPLLDLDATRIVLVPADDEVAAGRPTTLRRARPWQRSGQRERRADGSADRAPLASLEARSISAWFGSHHVLDRVSLVMPAGQVTALIGPSGCGKSTFLRILNRMHELIPSASLSGEVLLSGDDIYEQGRKLTQARREIGMVFQKPNPFPAMSIYDNVIAGLRLTGTRATAEEKDELVESCLRRAGLWKEVNDRLRQPGGGLSGGQQQRLCIARALAIRPRVLLMDEPCSALDPTSTRRIEETIQELGSEITIVIVTHNMQQAARVSDRCAFFLAEAGAPGIIIEHGPTDAMFHAPRDQRTLDYVNGRFG